MATVKVNTVGINELDLNLAGTVTATTAAGVTTINQSGVGGVNLETNGTPNGSQTQLNLVAGTNVTITDDGTGDVTIAASGGGGGTVTAVTASSPLASSGGTTPNITITSPLPVANGGTGTNSPAIVAGTNVTVSGTFPNQTVNATTQTATGTAGGDLSGTYPNPTVANVNGGVVPASAAFVGTNSSLQLVAATTPVTSLNTGTGAVTISAGSGATVTTVGSAITVGLAGSSSGIMTRTVFSAATRPLNTVFQNTSSFPIIVCASDTGNTTGTIGITDASATPTTQVWNSLTSSGNSNMTMFFVMPGNFYKVTGSTWQSWQEWVFNAGSFSASGDLVGTRTFGSNTQNTGAGFRVVQIIGTGTISVFCDATTTPTTNIAQGATVVASNSTIFIVPANYYYRVTGTAVTHWFEYTSNIAATSSGSLLGFRQVTSNAGQPPYSANQNTTGKVKFITGSFTNGNTGTTYLKSDQSCIPFIGCFAAHTGGNISGFWGIHLPGDFWAAWQDSGTSSTTTWAEMTLG